MIVLDVNILIGFLDDDDPHHDATIELLDRHLFKGFGSSALSVAEALVHPTRARRQDAALASLLAIGVRVMPVHQDDVLHLAQVRADYRVRMPDAVALHTAITTGSALATYDEALVKAAGVAGVAVVR